MRVGLLPALNRSIELYLMPRGPVPSQHWGLKLHQLPSGPVPSQYRRTYIVQLLELSGRVLPKQRGLFQLHHLRSGRLHFSLRVFNRVHKLRRGAVRH